MKTIEDDLKVNMKAKCSFDIDDYYHTSLNDMPCGAKCNETIS